MDPYWCFIVVLQHPRKVHYYEWNVYNTFVYLHALKSPHQVWTLHPEKKKKNLKLNSTWFVWYSLLTAALMLQSSLSSPLPYPFLTLPLSFVTCWLQKCLYHIMLTSPLTVAAFFNPGTLGFLEVSSGVPWQKLPKNCRQAGVWMKSAF